MTEKTGRVYLVGGRVRSRRLDHPCAATSC